MFFGEGFGKTKMLDRVTGGSPLVTELHVNAGRAKVSIPIQVKQAQDAQ